VNRSSTPHTVTYTPDYYAIGHASKFVHPGAQRIGSNDLGGAAGIETVAFRNPDGSIVLVVLNNADTPGELWVSWHARSFKTTISAGSVSTYLWHPRQK
jgi:glucosylceramidase